MSGQIRKRLAASAQSSQGSDRSWEDSGGCVAGGGVGGEEKFQVISKPNRKEHTVLGISSERPPFPSMEQ